MALDADTIQIAARLLRERKLSGRAITLGVQRVDVDYSAAHALLKAEGFPLRESSCHAVEAGKRLHQDTLFDLMGFDTVHSVDRYPDETPTHVLDLNLPIPAGMRAHYDFVCDSGTLEHCFDVPQVLENIVRLLRRGGHVLHATPISGWMQHAFYQISPNLYFDYYAANGFAELDAKVVYGGRCIDVRDLTRRDFLGQKALLVFVARKRESVAEIRAPIQKDYREKFEGIARTPLGVGSSRVPDPGRRSILDPSFWLRDLGTMVKHYYRLARKSRVI